MAVGMMFLVVFSMLYSIGLSIIYFSKERVDNDENKIYKGVLISNIVSLIFHMLCYVVVYIQDSISPILVNFVFKTFLVMFILFANLLLVYGMTILSPKNKKPIIAILISFIIEIIMIYALPIFLFQNEAAGVYYTYGPSVNYVYAVSALISNILIFIMIAGRKKKFGLKILPLSLFIVFGLIIMIIQMIYPQITLSDSVEAVLCCIMYFTIENPDVQAINTLLRNQELVEQTVNDKSNFLFKVSQEIKKPIQGIIDSVGAYSKAQTSEEKDSIVESISQDANAAYFIINDITNISSEDFKKFKIQGTPYITKKLLLDIKTNTENQLKVANKDKDIKLNFNLNNDYPEKLIGDYIKVKQVVLSLVSNSIKYTEKGFIDLDLDVTTKYDVCRLIFSIKDSGQGMEIGQINKLLSSNEEVDVSDFDKIDSLNLNIPLVVKVLKVMGGSVNIRSDKGKGTTIVIVIDQKIVQDKENKTLKSVKSYNLDFNDKARVLIADDNSDSLDKLGRLFSKKDTDVICTLIGHDAIDKINSGDKYNLIVLKDDMKPDSAYSILKELKENKKFNTPVVIIIKKDKEFIKDHFIKDGFSDCMIEEKIEDEVKRISEKYI
ncbi:MAG: hybrid sensor histidine kinase/response regulator [Bacilli bacterium]|nr:hybrid sensor histidine kinase/response regulator [Bacilli bacterium]